MELSKKPRVFQAAALLLFATVFAIDSHAASAAANPSGALVYSVRCAACHQAKGQGAGPYPPLALNRDVTSSDTQQLIATVVNGRSGPLTVGKRQYGGTMPGYDIVLSNQQIAAVLSYIRSSWGNNAPPISNDQIAAAARPVAFSGATIFVTTCGNCHPSGGGGTSSAPPLSGNPHVTANDPRQMLAIIVNGMSGPLVVNGKTYNAPMPSWHTRLSNADVAAVATYIRSAWSNTASAVTEDQVSSAGAPVSQAIGASLYAQHCASCHGTSGAGISGVALAGNSDVLSANASSLIRTVERGRSAMPSWNGQLSDADIASVLTYIRSAWGNNATAVSQSAVTAAK